MAGSKQTGGDTLLGVIIVAIVFGFGCYYILFPILGFINKVFNSLGSF